MNDQLQQIFSLQQALATAAAAAVINNLMNPQQQQQQPNTPQINNSNPALASQVAAMLAASANQPAQLNGDLTQQLISAAAANNVNDQGSQLQLHQQQQQLLQLQNTLNQLTEQQNRLNPATNLNLANSRSNSNSPSSNPAKSVGALSPPLISSHQHQPDLNSNPNQLHNLLMQLQQQAALQQSQTPAQLQQLSQSPLAALQGLNGLNGLAGQNASLASSPQSLLSALSGFVNPPAPAHQLHQNLNLNNHSSSPVRSPNIVHNNGRQSHNAEHKNTSNNTQSALKKVKRHHAPQQQSIPNHQLTDATSKPQAALLSQPGKNVHSSGQLSGASHLLNNRNSTSTNNSGSSSSATFSNLPRKLVRGQDVWLGRGAEQTRQILKCMWCQQSFKTLADMTEHMKLTQHYTNIVSQEQITSWKHPDDTKKGSKSKGFDGKLDGSSDHDDMFSGDDEYSESIHDQHQFNPISIVSDTNPEEFTSDTNKNDLENSPNDNIKENNSHNPRTTRSRKREYDSKPKPIRELRSARSQENKEHETNNIQGKDSNTNKLTSVTSDTNGLSNENSTNVDDEDIKNVIKQMLDREVSDVDGSDDDVEDKHEDEAVQKTANNISNNQKSPDIRQDGVANNSEVLNMKQINQSEQKGIATPKKLPDLPIAQADHQRNLFAQAENKLAQMAKSAQVQLRQAPQTDDPGNPLSALESMVETNVNSSGGILQRLGIDEEVGPPWQHINYANWCAAAYGNPMAAALLAAGLNFQNGLRLTKNLRKNDD